MTRINLISVNDLWDMSPRFVLAEYRELPRVFGYVKRVGLVNALKGQPSKYCLGKGHVKFFADKLNYLFTRYYDLYTVLWIHGYDLSFSPSGLAQEFFPLLTDPGQVTYFPSVEEVKISLDRLNQRMNEIRGK